MKLKSRIINVTNKLSETRIINEIIKNLPKFYCNEGDEEAKARVTINVSKLSGKKKTKRFNKNDVII